MDVNFYATLRAIVGKKTVHVDLPPNTTALQLVEMVSADYPALHAELLDAQNRFQRHMKMFINGREAVYLDQQFDTIIKPSDKWTSFHPWVAARMQEIIREMRGIPYFLLVEYLEELGGTSLSDDQVQGPGWSVKLVRMEPFRLGSLSVGQTRLEMKIEDNLVDDFMERFGKKTLRAGA